MSRTLTELKADNLSFATPESIGMEVGDLNETTRKALLALTEYLKAFIAGNKCPRCGSEIGGIFGSFMWGIANGEGMCANCKYPMRAIHRIKEVGTINNLILAYHPSVLEDK